MQIFIHCKTTLHVSGVTAPITRSIKNCTRSLRYRSYYLYRYSPPTWSDREWLVRVSRPAASFVCSVDGGSRIKWRDIGTYDYLFKLHSSISTSSASKMWKNVSFAEAVLTKFWKQFLISAMRAICPAHYIIFDLVTVTLLRKSLNSWSSWKVYNLK